METKNIIQVVIAATLATVIFLVIAASAIALPHTDRTIHGHYKVTESNWRNHQ